MHTALWNWTKAVRLHTAGGLGSALLVSPPDRMGLPLDPLPIQEPPRRGGGEVGEHAAELRDYTRCTDHGRIDSVLP